MEDVTGIYSTEFWSVGGNMRTHIRSSQSVSVNASCANLCFS